MKLHHQARIFCSCVAALAIGSVSGCSVDADRDMLGQMPASGSSGSAGAGPSGAAGVAAGPTLGTAGGGASAGTSSSGIAGGFSSAPPPLAGSPAADGGGTAGAGSAPGSEADNILRGSCKKSTVESNLLPANILFVLDRSGSMLCNPPPETQSSACEQMPVRDDPTAPSKWEITTQALLKSIRALPPSATVGLSYFSNNDECGVNAAPSVPLQSNTQGQQLAIEKSIDSVAPAGGTPLVGATISAYAHMHASALAGKVHGNEFVVLITDGAQSEQCSYAARCKDAASCTSLLVNEEVPKAAQKGVGIRTFAVGVPGSEPARTVLSQIAQSGGTAPADCEPQKGNCHFDMTTVPDLSAALTSALTEIAGEAISCELNVPTSDLGPLDPSLVNVVYTPSGGAAATVVRQDKSKACDMGANGWQYSDSTNTKIRLCGDICNTVRSDGGAKVDVVLGCPSLLQ